MARHELEPTIVSASTPSQNSMSVSADVSRANIDLVAGGRPKFTEETAELLRTRLTAVTLALAVILVAAFVANLVRGTYAAMGFRVATLIVIGLCLVALRSRRVLSLFQLRWIEVIVF